MADGHSSHAARRAGVRWRPLAWLAALTLLSLACMTSQYVFTVTRPAHQPDRAAMSLTMRLSAAYIQAAQLANAERRQDYAAAGLTPPTDFPTTVAEMEGLQDQANRLTESGFKVVWDALGFSATNEADVPATQGETSPLQIVRESPERIRYSYRMDLLDVDADQIETLQALAQLRQEGLGPKPPFPPPDEPPDGEPTTGNFWADLFLSPVLEGILGTAGEGMAAGGNELDGWYLQRILLASGWPVVAYTVELPGEIVTYEIDGVAMGEVDGGRVTLVMDEATVVRLGAGEHTLQVESVYDCTELCRDQFELRAPEGLQFHSGTGECPDGCTCWCLDAAGEKVPCAEGDCEPICRARDEHALWDGESEAPDCGCICAKGWEMQEAGCVACADICQQYDARAVYAAEASQDNRCGCACPVPLMRFEWGTDSGGCVCGPGAEPAGDGCACRAGWEPNVNNDGCVLKETTAPTCEQGQNCLSHPQNCPCPADQVCDPASVYSDSATGCSPKIAYVFVSTNMTDYEKVWVYPKINSIRAFFRQQGYLVRTVNTSELDDVAAYLGNASTRAIAYFDHGAYPSIHSATAGGVRNRLAQTLYTQYRQAGLSQEQARTLAAQRAAQPGLDYAYMHTCFSLSDNTMRDYLLRPGGTYWGHREKIWGPLGLEESVKP